MGENWASVAFHFARLANGTQLRILLSVPDVYNPVGFFSLADLTRMLLYACFEAGRTKAPGLPSWA